MTRLRKGFTLVELAIAMAFLGVLLITITILVIRIISIYQSGLSIRAVSASGRELIDEFTRAISGSPIADVAYNPATDDTPTDKYYFQKTAPLVEINGEEKSNVPLAGAFCTGLFTYIWNTGYTLNDDDLTGFTYTYDGENPLNPTTLENFRLIRIPDPDREICKQHIADREKSHFDASEKQKAVAPVELLESAEDSLAIYDLRIFPASANRITGHIFYSGTFILATLRGGVDIFTTGDYCTEEYDHLNTDFNYCAINKFNFAIRATGESAGQQVYGERGDQ